MPCGIAENFCYLLPSLFVVLKHLSQFICQLGLVEYFKNVFSIQFNRASQAREGVEREREREGKQTKFCMGKHTSLPMSASMCVCVQQNIQIRLPLNGPNIHTHIHTPVICISRIKQSKKQSKTSQKTLTCFRHRVN